MFSYFIYTIVILSCFASTLNARIIHVPSDSSTIQGGIDGAVDGDTVLVSPGTYLEHDIDFQGKGITVVGTEPEDSAVVASTVVNGGSLGSVFVFQLGEDSTSVLSGLTITGGRETGGGGISCSFSSPDIEYCIIWGNRSGGGGGISFTNSAANVSNCTITYNLAIDYGGGVQCLSSSPAFSNCTFRLNRAVFAGGGIDCFSSSPRFENCTISNNEVTEPFTNYGGGLSLAGSSVPTLINCEISDNMAPGTNGAGGGLYCASSSSAILQNCVVSGNVSGDRGGGLYIEGSTPEISFCTITENSADQGGGIYLLGSGAAAEATNSILWGNSADEIFIVGGSIDISYTDVEGGWAGEGNIDSDPRFVTFHLLRHLLHPASPCIDAGDPNFMDGIDWPLWYPNEPRADMGAYGGPGNTGWLPLHR